MLLEKIERKIEEIKTNVFERADQFNMDEEKDRVTSEAFDNEKNYLLRELVEIEFKIKKLNRKKDTMNTGIYESERYSLISDKRTVEKKIEDREWDRKFFKWVLGGALVVVTGVAALAIG